MNAGSLAPVLARARRLSPLGWATALSTLNSLVIAVVYARVAGAAAYGTFQLALALSAVAGIIALGGAPTAAMRAAAEGRSIARALFRRRLPWCGLASMVLAAGAAGLFAAGDEALAAAVLAAVLLLPATVGGDVVPAEMLGSGRFRAYLRYQVGLQSVSAALVAAAAVAAPDSPWLAVLALQASIGAWQLRTLARLRQPRPPTDEDLRYARGLSGLNILTNVDARLDILLAGALLGSRETGIVAVARTLPLAMKHVWELLYQPIFNRLAASSRDDAAAWMHAQRWKLVAGLGGMNVAAAALCPLVIPPVFGDEFDDAVLPAQLVLLAAALLTVGSLESVFLKASGRIRQLTILLVALPVASLLVLPPALAVAGPTGIGVKALVVAAVHVTLAIWLTRRVVSARP